MFLARRPSPGDIDRFLRLSEELPLSYDPVGITDRETGRYRLDEQVVTIGRGQADFARARAALQAWTQFEIGWVELFPRHAPVAAGIVVAVLVHHLGFWSLNGCRVLHRVDDGARFGLAYGTLTNHAEEGEEIFEVSIDPATDDVFYRIRAASRPRAALARLGRPIARSLQARFRRDSVRAMMRPDPVLP
jgi:uncharacterized protein (UPF0548 family)